MSKLDKDEKVFKAGDLVRYISPDGKIIIQGFMPKRDLADCPEEEDKNFPHWPDSDGSLRIDVEGKGVDCDYCWIEDVQYVTCVKRVD